MRKEEKIAKNLKEEKYVNDIKKEFEDKKESFSFSLVLDREPENYVRERYTGRGRRFYNAKEKIMKEMHSEIEKLVPQKYKDKLKELLKNEIEYYVILSADFYVRIPKADSTKKIIQKELKLIRPAIAPDLDNFVKLLADVLHNIIYTDDKRIIEIQTSKFYSLKPRTELTIKIVIPNN